jgi:hypothetical protein
MVYTNNPHESDQYHADHVSRSKELSNFTPVIRLRLRREVRSETRRDPRSHHRSKAEERVLGQCKQRGYVGPHAFPDFCHTPPSCSGVGQS